MSPTSILITKEGDMRENSTSNDATRQWRQFAGSFCKLWSHVWNKDPLTFEMDGLFELRSMLRAKKEEKKGYDTLKISPSPHLPRPPPPPHFLSDIYLLSKHVTTRFFWIIPLILTVIALEAGTRASLRAQNIINIIIVWVLFIPVFSVISKELYLHDGSSVLTE